MDKVNLLRLAIVQIGIIIVIIILVLFVLHSLNALPFSNPFSSTSQNPSGIKPKTPINSNISADIHAVSDSPGYTLSMQNKEEVIALLKQWGIYGSAFTGGYGIKGSTGSNDGVKDIEVHFTTVEQPINQYVNPDGSVYLSSITNASAGKLTVYAYIGPSILKDTSKNSKLGGYFDVIALSTLYRLANPAKSLDENSRIEEQLNKFLKEKAESETIFFKLEKNN